MRFVTSEVVRIDLKDGVDAKGGVVKNWVEIKKELSKGEATAMRSGGLKRMVQGSGEGETAVDVNWTDLALSRVTTYLTDWSANENGKAIKLTPKAIAEMCEEDFEEIDAAIVAHIERLAEEKKVTAGSPKPAPPTP